MEYENKKLKEFNEYLKNRNVAIIGLGVSNLPLLKYMNEKQAKVTVFDEKEKQDVPRKLLERLEKYKANAFFGQNCFENLKGFDIIFRSPSCLPTRKELVLEKERGAIITSEIEMLMKLAPCKIIGVTRK